MTAIAHKSMFVPLRRARATRRFSLVRGVQLLDRIFRRDHVRLRNISAGGFSADGSSGVTVGEAVWIELPGIGPVQSEVKWTEEDRFGASFVETDCLRLRFINGLPKATPVPRPAHPAPLRAAAAAPALLR
jgi:hypothetical protein